MFIEEFLTYMRCELNYSVHTVLSYQTDLEQWREWSTDGGRQGFDPCDVTVSDLRAWLAYESSRTTLSAATMRRKVQSLRAFYRFMMQRHALEANPAAELTPAKIPSPLPTYIPPGETKKLFDSPVDTDSFNDVRNRLIMLMLYTTGMRRNELLTLLDRNVDTVRGELKVLGKRNKERIIPFGNELTTMIETYRRLRSRDIAAPADTFFVKDDGESLYAKYVYNIVNSTLKEAGVHAARLSPHVMRHSFATDMLNNGAELSAVQQLLGHKSLATTQVYTHIAFRDLKHNYQLAHPRAKRKGG